MSRKIVDMRIQVTFDGDYYSADELAGVVEGFILMGLEDRDNLTGWTVVNASVTETEEFA